MTTKTLFFWMGIFLIADAALSLYWSKFRLGDFIGGITTMNNSTIGNLVRIARGIIGGVLVYNFR